MNRLPADAKRGSLEHASNLTTEILEFAATVAGLAAENMVRGGGRLFLDFGRRVERAQSIAAELAQVLDQPGALTQPGRVEAGLRLALELRDSVITYRTRYLAVLQPAPGAGPDPGRRRQSTRAGVPTRRGAGLAARDRRGRRFAADGDGTAAAGDAGHRAGGAALARSDGDNRAPAAAAEESWRTRSARWRTGCRGGISPCCRWPAAWACRNCCAGPRERRLLGGIAVVSGSGLADLPG